jgi:hypothetical protein
VRSRGGTQVRHEEGGEVFRVGAALDVRVCFLGHGGAEGALDEGKGGDVAVVHYGVDAEGEGVVIGWCDGCRGRRSNVCQEDRGGRVGAEAAEVGIVEGRLDRFVKCGVQGGLG